MNPDFGPAASGGETGCAATVVAVSAGAVDPFRLSGESVAADSSWISADGARRPAAHSPAVIRAGSAGPMPIGRLPSAGVDSCSAVIFSVACPAKDRESAGGVGGGRG